MRGDDALAVGNDERGTEVETCTYDATTQTVLFDDGERESVFSVDSCPLCGKHLFHSSPHPTDPPYFRPIEQAVCFDRACGFQAVRDAEPAPAS